MKPRARRIALLSVAACCLFLAGFVAFNWNTVRDHAEAWWFQAMRETAELEPSGQLTREGGSGLQILANRSGLPVIYGLDTPEVSLGDGAVPPAQVLSMLGKMDFRITEQRFPRRAYVVVGYPGMQR